MLLTGGASLCGLLGVASGRAALLAALLGLRLLFSQRPPCSHALAGIILMEPSDFEHASQTSPSRFRWQVSEEEPNGSWAGRWRDFHSSWNEQLEAAFKGGASEVELFEDEGDHMYTVDFDLLEQTNFWTCKVRTVRRAQLPRAVLLDILLNQAAYKTKSTRFQWQVCETTGEGRFADRWMDFDSLWNDQLGVAFHSDASEVNLCGNEDVHVYTVDLIKFTQTNIWTGTVRAVRLATITDKGA
jgi:hypothetical protein